ncbi:MAG: choice-of-anchor J domain-containing protein [Bacteroidota bacterium]
MKKFTLFFSLLLMSSWIFAQRTLTHLPLKKQVNSTRMVDAIFTSTNFYVPGTTMDLTFTLELTNTDGEFGDSLAMAFPDSVAPNSSPDDPFPSTNGFGQPAESLNGVSGQVISWGDNDNNFGGIEPGSVYPFTINVTIAPGATGQQAINVYVSGDGYGATPMDFAGVLFVNPLPAAPVAEMNSTDGFDAVTLIGQQDTSDVYLLRNIGGDTLRIDSLVYSNGGMDFSDNLTAMSLAPGDSTSFSFIYAPTDQVDDIDTFNIYTNDTNFAIALGGYPYGGDVVLEGFEGISFFPMCQWGLEDADGDGFNWGARAATQGIAPHTGALSVISESWNAGVGPLNPNNYFITPQITPTANANFFSWFAAAQDPAFPAEFYEVYVSTTGTAPADFTTSLFNETLSDAVWRERRVDLSAYVGQNIYLAFRHHNVSDQFVMKIDDIRMPPKTTPDAQLTPLDFSTQVIDVECPGDTMGGFQAILTGGGNLYIFGVSSVDTTVESDDLLAVANLAEGTYFVDISDNCFFAASDTVTIGARNPMDDASFSFATDTICQNDTLTNVSITGLTGGTFSSTAGLAIDASTGQIDPPNSTQGTYTVTYLTSGPCPNSSTFEVTIGDICAQVGIESLFEQGLSVYPNPSSGQFYLENLEGSRDANIEITDLTGKVVHAESLYLHANETHVITLSDLSTGMYLIKVHSNDKIGVERLIVN